MIGCGFGEVIGVDELWFWGMIGINMFMVLGRCAGVVIDKAMATPASLKILTLKSVFFGEYGCDFGEVCRCERGCGLGKCAGWRGLWFWEGFQGRWWIRLWLRQLV